MRLLGLLALGSLATVILLVAFESKPARRPSPPRNAGGDQEQTNLASEDLPRITEGDGVSELTFAGRVVATEDAGVGGAEVVLAYVLPDGSGPHLVRRGKEKAERVTTTTDNRGYFRFDRSYASKSRVIVHADGFVSAVTELVTPGRFIRVVLSEEPLRVHVVGPAREPVSGALVNLATGPMEFEGRPDNDLRVRHVLAQAKTDEAGVATMPQCPRDGLVLEVHPLQPRLGSVVERCPGGMNKITIALPSVRTLSIQVLDQTTRAPLSDAYVMATRTNPHPLSRVESPRRIMYANAEGRLVVPIERQWRLLVGAPGYETKRAASETVYLRRAVHIEGTVFDRQGMALPGAAIVAFLGNEVATLGLGLPPVSAWSDENGVFAFDLSVLHSGVGPGSRTGSPTLSLVSLASGHAPAIVALQMPAPGSDAIVELRHLEGASLEVWARDTQGNPMSNRTVTARRVGQTCSGKDLKANGIRLTDLLSGSPFATDNAGRVLISPLAPGCYRLALGTASVLAEARAGERRNVDFVIGGGPSISGRVIDKHGIPQRNAVVRLSGPSVERRRTDDEGRFGFADLDEAVYTLEVRFESGRLRNEASPGQFVLMQEPMGPCRIRLRVDGPPQTACEYSLVTVSGSHVPEQPGFVRLDSSGMTKEFMPGHGVIVVRASGHSWRAVAFEARAGVMDIDVHLPKSGAIKGLVTHLPEEGLFARVQRVPSPYDVTNGSARLRYAIDRCIRPMVRRIASTSGELHFADVSPGKYRVFISRREGTTWRNLVTEEVEVSSGDVVEVRLQP